jgi:hypothetical protein
MRINLTRVIKKGEIVDGTDTGLPADGGIRPRRIKWRKARIAKRAKTWLSVEHINVRRDAATSACRDFEYRRHDVCYVGGGTELLLISEVFKTIGHTASWHIFHENPLCSHGVVWCATIEVDLRNGDTCAG